MYVSGSPQNTSFHDRCVELHHISSNLSSYFSCRLCIDFQWRHLKCDWLHYYCYYYYYYTRFIMDVRSFTTWRISSADKVTCQWRNARLYRAVLSLDLFLWAMLLEIKVIELNWIDTVMSEITVTGRLFQIVGEAWQKALLEKLGTAGLLQDVGTARS